MKRTRPIRDDQMRCDMRRARAGWQLEATCFEAWTLGRGRPSRRGTSATRYGGAAMRRLGATLGRRRRWRRLRGTLEDGAFRAVFGIERDQRCALERADRRSGRRKDTGAGFGQRGDGAVHVVVHRAHVGLKLARWARTGFVARDRVSRAVPGFDERAVLADRVARGSL